MKDSKNLVEVIYGDTDSVIDSLLTCYDQNYWISELFELGQKQGKQILQNGTELVKCDKKILNYSKDNKLEYQPIKYIMRHKVTKPKWSLVTKFGKEIIVTNDHSMIVFRDGNKLTVKPYEILSTDKILLVVANPLYILDDIERCECIGQFEDEYVYDIEMDDDTHTFIANDILVHNSLYMSYDGLLNSIEGVENMSQREKLEVIVKLNEEFLNDHNNEFMEEYYKSRHVKSAQLFELETVNLKGLWLGVKKRYAQILLWKDGKFYDEDNLPMKVKGLEMNKSSYPKFVRGALNRVVRSILESKDTDNLWEKTNILVQQERMKFNQAPLEDICASSGVNGYNKYIITKNEYYMDVKHNGMSVIDGKGTVLYTAPKCPANVRALGTYNTMREAHKLPGDPIYGGKCRIYFYRPTRTSKDVLPFGFQAKNYPKWAAELAPVDRNVMFQKYFLDPLNRICGESMGFAPFTLDGARQMDLFDELF